MSFLVPDLRKYIIENFMSVSRVPSPEQRVVEPLLQKPTYYESTIDNTPTLEQVNALPRYYYLEGDQLTREFGFNRDLTKSHILYLCAYRVNTLLEKPFVEFCFQNKNGTYDFPSKTLAPELFKDILEPEDRVLPLEQIGDNIDEEDGVEDIFLDNCVDFFKETFGDNAVDKYKGFVEFDDYIFAVFDCIDIEDKPDNIWAINDEVLNKRKIFKTPVSEIVLNMFLENRVLINIRDKDGKVLPNPIVAYLLNENYENVYYKEEESSHTTASILNEKVNHPLFHNVYLFSLEPLVQHNEVSKIKRFALFIDGGLLVENGDVPILDYKTDEGDVPDYSQYDCIGFKENNNDFWLTRSRNFFIEL